MKATSDSSESTQPQTEIQRYRGYIFKIIAEISDLADIKRVYRLAEYLYKK